MKQAKSVPPPILEGRVVADSGWDFGVSSVTASAGQKLVKVRWHRKVKFNVVLTMEEVEASVAWVRSELPKGATVVATPDPSSTGAWKFLGDMETKVTDGEKPS